MGHLVTGLIAKPALLEALSREQVLPWPVALAGGVAILPLREVDLAPLTVHSADPEWPHSMRLLEELLLWSRHGLLMYFQTEYFGELGGQGAVVVRAGELIFGPRWAEIGPINEGLKLLGVSVERPAQDEFETVGLHLHRRTKGWIGAQ
jgi:hypothetical protein